MNTYQDLLRCGESEKKRIEFMRKAINEHTSSNAFQFAVKAEKYYRNENPTITNFHKFLYKLTGERVIDNIGANYRCSSCFFRKFVIQEVQYLLSNGVKFNYEETKEKLGGNNFDVVLQDIAKWAIVHGVCYGFFNLNQVQVMKMTELVPLFDELDGQLKGAIRFWRIDETKPMRITLFELDGYTDYVENENKDFAILTEKRPYILRVRETIAERTFTGENYSGFPIVPMYANDIEESELKGKQESIDAYDFIKSGMANEIEDIKLVYWTISNAGGMDEVDIANFIERLKTVGATTVEEDGAQAEAHQITPQIQPKETMLQRLERDMYRDFMATDTNIIANGAVTATQIEACYEPLNEKVNDFEYCVLKFLNQIMALAGVEDNPTFTRDKILNMNETISAIMACADYLDDETILDLLPIISSEQVQIIMDRKKNEVMGKFSEQDL